jgi:hypothetical protein
MNQLQEKKFSDVQISASDSSWCFILCVIFYSSNAHFQLMPKQTAFD